MTLPVIKRKTNFMIMPSTGKRVSYYSLDAGTEKKIGMIKEGYRQVFEDLDKSGLEDDDVKLEFGKQMKDLTTDIFEEMKKCFPDVDFTKITEGDFEAMQIELKRKYVDSQLNLNVTCPKCGADNSVTLNLDEIKLKECETEKEITLEDGSILVLRHIPMLDGTMNLDFADMEAAEYDYAVNSFALLKYKVGGVYKEIDFANYTFKDKVEWADQSINVENKKDILNFLSNAPGIEPIELKVKMCKQKMLDGKKLPDDPKSMELHIKRYMQNNKDGVPFGQKMTTCGESYSTKVYNVSQFFF